MERWGQKKGAGFYDYDDKRRPSPSPVVQAIIEEFATKQGVERREISDEEIVERTLYTMVNEGAKILEEGIAQRASDIDVVWVYGYGWPVYRGGPMFWADSVGLQKIVDGLKRQEQRMKPDFGFSPAASRQGRERRELHAVKRWLGLALALAVAGGAATAASPRSAAAPTPATIERVVGQNAAHGFSGTVLVAKGDRVLLDRGYGAVHGVRMRADTRYWISSTGKQFVAAAILLLQEQGKLGLDDPIAGWFPEAPADKRAITIAQLLSHTSCIVQGYEGEESSSNAEAVRRILAVPLETPRVHRSSTRTRTISSPPRSSSARAD